MDTNHISRLIAVLAEAAGREHDHTVFADDAAGRQRTIELLESLGFIEARSGSPELGESADWAYITGITEMGRMELDELLQTRATPEGESSTKRSRGVIARVLTCLGF
ncbi:MAG TPA: hypothetical protein VNA88_01560 [Candidatus Kapabacteria bacterium]|jgi:hypothetical protein|nr:hypothetical protein [Candidatus Kapabacteria bacterium]